MKDTYMQFSEAPSYFLSRRPRYFSEHPILEYRLPLFFLNTRDQFSHPHKITAKVRLYISLLFLV